MWTNHEGADVIAAVEVGAVLSTQFHPEKSGAAGLALLQSWVETLEGK
jgi:glutamine amidotransferase